MATTTASGARLDFQVTGIVCVAHALSHFFQLVITPLLPLMKDEFGLSFAALGTMMTVTYVVSGSLQTVAGFAVDRFGPRLVLTGGLAAMAAGTLILALAPSYGWLLVAGAIIGVGNSTFHPADLALLNAKIAPARLGYAFSAHSIAGNIGWVVAPVFSASIAAQWGWRTALLAAAALGVVFVAYLSVQRVLNTQPAQPSASPQSGTMTSRGGLSVLGQREVLMCAAFFFLTAMAISSFMSFGPTTLIALYDIPLVMASGVLTAFLIGGTAGTLAGGVLAARVHRHDSITAVGIAVGALLTMLIATGAMAPSTVPVLAFLVGAVIGVTNPARDILVRNAAPADARGKVYGFVYSGLDVGAAIAPLLFGWFLDAGRPAWVFIAAALLLLLCVPTAYRLRPVSTDNR